MCSMGTSLLKPAISLIDLLDALLIPRIRIVGQGTQNVAAVIKAHTFNGIDNSG